MFTVEIHFVLCILCAPFVVATILPKVDRIHEKALLIGRFEIARIYRADNYEEFRDRPDLRSEEDYRSTFYPRRDEPEGTIEEKIVKRTNLNKLRESVYAVSNARDWIEKMVYDASADGVWEEFSNRSTSYRMFIEKKLESKELLQWPRIVYDSDTKVLTIIPEKFLPNDMTIQSEIDYVRESRTNHSGFIENRLPFENNSVSFQFHFIENMNDDIKENLSKKLKEKIRFSTHRIIPMSHSMTLLNSILPFVNYIESLESHGVVLRNNKETETVKVLCSGNAWKVSGDRPYLSEIEPNFESSLTHAFFDKSGNLFFGPASENREDDPKDGFETNSPIIFPTTGIYLKLREIYENQIEMIEKYHQLKKNNEKMNEGEERQFFKNILDQGGDELKKFSAKFRKTLIQQQCYTDMVSNDYRLKSYNQPIPFDPTMWEVSENEQWRLRMVEERNWKYIPDWLENIIKYIENETGVSIIRSLEPSLEDRVSDPPQSSGAVLILDRFDGNIFVYSDPRADVGTDYVALGSQRAILRLAELTLKKDRHTVRTKLDKLTASTSSLIQYIAHELEKENPDPTVLNILRPLNLLLRPNTMPPELILQMPGTPEGGNNNYALAATAMMGVAICHAVQGNPNSLRRGRYSTSYDDNALVKILTYGSADERTINENIYKQLVTEYQSLSRDVTSNLSLVQYMKEEIVNETSNSVLRNIVRNICLEMTTTTTSATHPASIPPSRNDDDRRSRSNRVKLTYLLLNSGAGCLMGAATGTFILPGLGSVFGCGYGALTGFIGSSALSLAIGPINY